jgi:hypothetical protein
MSTTTNVTGTNGPSLLEQFLDAASKGAGSLDAYVAGLSDAAKKELGVELALLAQERRKLPTTPPAFPPSPSPNVRPAAVTPTATNNTTSGTTGTTSTTTPTVGQGQLKPDPPGTPAWSNLTQDQRQKLLDDAGTRPYSSLSSSERAFLDYQIGSDSSRFPAKFAPGSYVAYGLGLADRTPNATNGLDKIAADAGYKYNATSGLYESQSATDRFKITEPTTRTISYGTNDGKQSQFDITLQPDGSFQLKTPDGTTSQVFHSRDEMLPVIQKANASGKNDPMLGAMLQTYNRFEQVASPESATQSVTDASGNTFKASFNAQTGSLMLETADGQAMRFKDDQALLDFITGNPNTKSPMVAAAQYALDNYFTLTGQGDPPITGDHFTADMAKYLDDSVVQNLPTNSVERYRFEEARKQILDVVRGRPTDAKVVDAYDGSSTGLNPRVLANPAEIAAVQALLQRQGARNTDPTQETLGGPFYYNYGTDDRRMTDIHGMSVGLILETYLRNPANLANQMIARDLASVNNG